MDLAELRQTPHLSASGVRDYLDCGLLFKFSRIDRLKPEFRSDALLLGTAIHLALGDHYQARMEEGTFSAQDLLECFEIHWRRLTDGNEAIRFAEGNNAESLLAQGKELLKAWREHQPEEIFRVLAIEEAFSFRIPGVPLQMIGAIDLIEEDDSGTLIITDFKTVGRGFSADEVNNNLQLTVYHQAMKLNGYKDREILMRLDCLVKTKTPRFEQYWTSRGEADEKRLVKKIQTVWEGINRQVFIPSDGGWRCKNCPYGRACSAWFEGGET